MKSAEEFAKDIVACRHGLTGSIACKGCESDIRTLESKLAKAKEGLKKILSEEVATMRGNGFPENKIAYLHPESPKGEMFTSRIIYVAARTLEEIE